MSKTQLFDGVANFVYTPLDYDTYRESFQRGELAAKIAETYHRSAQEVKELSADPDHHGQMTLSSLLETMVAFELEATGVLGCKVTRGPAHTDLEDGWGRKWDVKTPPYVDKIGFNVEAAVHSILKKFSEFPNGSVGILLDISFLHPENYKQLSAELQSKLSALQKFLVRQVTVEGVLT